MASTPSASVSKRLVLVTVTAALGFFLFGYDTAVINGAIRANVDEGGDRGDEQCVRLTESDRAPEGGRVVEDDVDTDELLGGRDEDAYPHDRLEPERPTREIA